MGASEDLVTIETALRNAIRQALPDWQSAPEAPDLDGLRGRRRTEENKREGVVTSDDLLDYIDTPKLFMIVDANWDAFAPIFDDQDRFATFAGIVRDVRNSVAHSRPLVPFEEHLLAGVAGQLRNQVAMFRGSENPSSRYYPLIESAQDSFGQEGLSRAFGSRSEPLPRLDVGQVVTFRARATAGRSFELRWLHVDPGPLAYGVGEVGFGEEVDFSYTVTSEDVGEKFHVGLAVTTESKYHRFKDIEVEYDDIRFWEYSVNPPADE